MSALGLERRIQLMQNSLVNNSGYLVAGVLGLVLLPIRIRGLGAESYGLWIVSLGVAGVPGIFGFGVNFSVKREVAAWENSSSDALARLVVTAGYSYAALGIVGGLIVASLGQVFASRLHPSTVNQGIAPYVFSLVGMACFAGPRSPEEADRRAKVRIFVGQPSWSWRARGARQGRTGFDVLMRRSVFPLVRGPTTRSGSRPRGSTP